MDNITNKWMGKEVVIMIPYPPWATLKNACQLFGVGKDRINEWTEKGYVRRVGNRTSVQFCCEDIDRTMKAIAVGMQPRPMRRR